MAGEFAWIPFYRAMADAVSAWRGRAGELYEAVRALAKDNPLLGYFHFEKEDVWKARGFALDPFSALAVFNRGVTAEHRAQLAAGMARLLGVALAPPRVFHGIPHLDPRHSLYAGGETLWALMDAALGGVGDTPPAAFAPAYDAAAAVKGNALGALSIGLFWMRPERFMAVDGMSRPWMEKRYDLAAPADGCSGAEYAAFLTALRAKIGLDGSFPGVALAAWQAAHP